MKEKWNKEKKVKLSVFNIAEKMSLALSYKWQLSNPNFCSNKIFVTYIVEKSD